MVYHINHMIKDLTTTLRYYGDYGEKYSEKNEKKWKIGKILNLVIGFNLVW